MTESPETRKQRSTHDQKLNRSKRRTEKLPALHEQSHDAERPAEYSEMKELTDRILRVSSVENNQFLYLGIRGNEERT